jgi:hypothetical protein
VVWVFNTKQAGKLYTHTGLCNIHNFRCKDSERGLKKWCTVGCNYYWRSKKQICLTATVFDDVPSFFFLKVSKFFHKTANSFSVYIFLSLTVQSSKMCGVFSWNLCFEAKLFERAIINIIFVLICCLYVTLNISKKQIKTKNVNFWLFLSN